MCSPERPALNDNHTAMKTFVCTPEQAEEFKMNFVKGLVTGCVPFAFVENELLHRAMRSVGVQRPSRKQLGGSYLDRISKQMLRTLSACWQKLSSSVPPAMDGASGTAQVVLP
jgi:hypothetical protein